MRLLGGFTAAFQVDRSKLLELARATVTLAGVPIIAPFRLKIPAPPKDPLKLGTGQSPLDLVIKDVELRLVPGGREGRLVLRIDGGVVRTGGATVVLRGGAVEVRFEWQDHNLAALSVLDAALDPPPSPRAPPSQASPRLRPAS